MPEYQAPLRDMRFVLHELFAAESQWQELGLEEVNRELADAILEEAGRISQSLIAPLLRSGDEQGVRWQDGDVITPDGYREAYRTLAEGGWAGLAGNPDFGGQGLPKSLVLLFEEMLYSGSIAMGLYLTLTSGAALAIDAHASEELKQAYLPKLYDGSWAGAMCLTEAHAGTDLGMIRTKAEPQADGSYRLNGSKIFITGGEHDLTENIIHLVLAKLPDAPPGSKGISLFLVPKIQVNADGSLGERNGVSCGSVEEKMGIHASATCVLNFDDALGYLVGEPNRGLAAMFTMMNYERLSVGIQGLSAASCAYQWSLDYARERLQGRSPAGKQNKDAAADPIIVHPDVRRMLLTQKSLVEAGRAFAVHVGQQLDIAKFGSGEAKQQAQGQVDLLTPIAKAFLTDRGLEGCVMGQQTFGGHGYVREWGMEQLVRDVRITQIYEGTNGIQAQDLLGRKVVGDGGRNLKTLLDTIREFIASAQAIEGAEAYLGPLQEAIDTLEAVSDELLIQAKTNPHAVGAASVPYLQLTGYTLYGWMWARSAVYALQQQNRDDFLEAKLLTANFYMSQMLPQVGYQAALIRGGSEPLMALGEAGF